jgi:hypothetical protein
MAALGLRTARILCLKLLVKDTVFMPLYEFECWDGPPVERIGSGIGLGRLWVCKSRARKSFEATKTSLYCRFAALVLGWRRFQMLCDDVTRVDSEVVFFDYNTIKTTQSSAHHSANKMFCDVHVSSRSISKGTAGLPYMLYFGPIYVDKRL